MVSVSHLCNLPAGSEKKSEGVGGLTKEMNSPGIYRLDKGGKGHRDIDS